MIEAGIGRLLVASLHQGIADLLPTRLEFYEAWLNPAGLRHGTIGLAPLAAVLSFLRLEGEPYRLIAGRAGEYTAEWTVADLSAFKRKLIRNASPRLRVYLVMRLARTMIRNTYRGSRAIVRWRKGTGAVDIRGSIFCEVRDPVEQPLCEFYAAAIRRLMQLFDLEVEVGTEQCRATGAGQCLMKILLRSAQALACASVVWATPVGAQTTPASPPARQLMIPFENASHEARLFWLSEGSAILLSDDLTVLGVPVISRDDRLRAFDRLRVPRVATLSLATVIRLGQVVGAAHVVVGDFALQGEEIVVRARSIRLDSGRMLPEIIERGPLEELIDVYGRVARRLAPTSPVSAEQLNQQHPPVGAFEQYVKGLLAEDPDARVDYLTQALRLYPAFQPARVALWSAHDEAGDHLPALAIVRQIPPGHRLFREARFLAALSLINLGQYAEAFDTFTALNREGADPALLNNLGIVQLRRPAGGPGGRAVEYFAQAVKIDGGDADLFFNLGYAYWLDRDLAGAISWLREAVRRNPADDEAHYVLGVALQESGNLAEAAREKELARQLSSSWAEWEAKQRGVNAPPLDLERLKTEIDVSESLRVEDVVVAAEQRDQRAVADFHLERGRRFFDEERDAEAVAELRRTIFLAPYESQAHLLLARIYLRTGRAQEAIDALKIALWSDPSNEEARALLEKAMIQ